MKKGIIGKKIGMTQIFDEVGNVVPVTIIEAGPCVVAQKKTVEHDGYSSVQLGFEDAREKSLNKAEKGHFAKAGVAMKKHLKEFRLDDAESMNVGDIVSADVFAAGDRVDVTGMTKGRGTGPIHRQPGSMGANSSPSRIFKNKHMAGQYGNEKVTIQNLDVVRVDAEKNLIAVKGAVPGARGGIVFIRNTVKA